MIVKVLTTVSMIVLPSLASAEPQPHVYLGLDDHFTNIRDGTNELRIREGRESIEAFQRLKELGRRMPPARAVTSQAPTRSR